jgi:hypothetical protein
MKELSKKKWTYILYEINGQLLFSVVCGTVALFDRNIYLNEEEIKIYNEKKDAFLDLLAEKIRNSPDKFEDRHIKI